MMMFGKKLISGAALLAALSLYGNYDDAAMKQLWQDRIAGTNLAAGVALSYAPTPDYKLTMAGGTDGADLTDGKLVTRNAQAIWFDGGAVGWQAAGEKTVVLDFGRPVNVGKLVWRVVAGNRVRGFSGPRQIAVYGGDASGRAALLAEYHRAGDDLASPDNYSLPDLGELENSQSVYVYPIAIPLGDTRVSKLIIRFEQDSPFLVSDELAVIAGAGEGRLPDPSKLLAVQTAGVWIASPEARLPLLPGAALPVWLNQSDYRVGGAKQPVEYEFILPPGVRMEASGLGAPAQREGRTVYRLAAGGNRRIGPIYWSVDGDAAEYAVRYRAVAPGDEAQPEQTVVLYAASWPELPASDNHEAWYFGIGWIGDGLRMQWPDFAGTSRRIGFDLVATHPSGWVNPALESGTLTLDQLRNAADPAVFLPESRSLAELRRAGFKIMMNYSPFHVVNWRFKNDREYRCLGAEKGIHDSWCMSYAGKYRQMEIDAIVASYEVIGGAELVMFDTELFGTSYQAALNCTRCRQAFAASGMSDFRQYFVREVARFFHETVQSVKAVAQRRNWPEPRFALYGITGKVFGSHGFITVGDLPGIDIQSPSLYVGNHPAEIARGVSEAVGASALPVIPWLTTATYGYVTPVNCKIMVWANFVNGARGGVYYQASDLNPAQLHAIAEAMAALRPQAAVLQHGRPASDEFQSSDPAVRVAACRDGGRALLLLYNSGAAARTVTLKHGDWSRQYTVPARDAILAAENLK